MAGQQGPELGRRSLFGLAGVGAVGAGGLSLAACTRGRGAEEAPSLDPRTSQRRRYSPHEEHQAGIVTPTPAATTIVALDLLPGSNPDRLRRLLTLWSQDIEALMDGRKVPGDPLPDLAQAEVSLSVTVGFGRRVFALPGLEDKLPDGLAEIPSMRHDKLRPEWSGGDLVLQVCADDATSVAYAVRTLTRDARTFASVRWTQHGSWRAVTADGAPATGRNLFGQVDGTGNITADAGNHIWTDGGQDWFTGGTMMVVRRIEMNLATWDGLVRDRQEQVIGRTLGTGAPLSAPQGAETDPLDLAARDKAGRPLIPVDAHARLAHPSQNGDRTMFRRGTNYTFTETRDGHSLTTSGLVFVSFQTSIPGVFTPVQTRLDQHDALNEWTTAIGSAVFALPGGFKAGETLASELFS